MLTCAYSPRYLKNQYIESPASRSSKPDRTLFNLKAPISGEKEIVKDERERERKEKCHQNVTYSG